MLGASRRSDAWRRRPRRTAALRGGARRCGPQGAAGGGCRAGARPRRRREPAGPFSSRPAAAARRRPLPAPRPARAPPKDSRQRPRAGMSPLGRRGPARNARIQAGPGPAAPRLAGAGMRADAAKASGRVADAPAGAAEAAQARMPPVAPYDAGRGDAAAAARVSSWRKRPECAHAGLRRRPPRPAPAGGRRGADAARDRMCTPESGPRRVIF